MRNYELVRSIDTVESARVGWSVEKNGSSHLNNLGGISFHFPRNPSNLTTFFLLNIIKTVQKMVFKNTKITVCWGMMMYHIVTNCINNNSIAVPIFIDLGFVAKVLTYIKNPSSQKCFWSIVQTCK